MRFKSRTWVAVTIVVLSLSGCDIQGPQFSADAVSGTIAGNAFTFVSGYAGPNSTDASYWTVYLIPEAPASGTNPWDTGAYTDGYPYLSFSFKTSLAPGEFTISTYAGTAADESIGIEGWLTFFDNILFDSGTLIIDVFDGTANGEVSGRISADTRDGSSSVNGTFEVPIDPRNL